MRTVTDRDELNDLMGFDHVIRVLPGGIATDEPAAVGEVWAPELRDGNLDNYRGDTWTLLDGYSGQQGYSGPEMHPSEYIGGGMADDILSTPGLYVSVLAYYTCEDGTEADHDASECLECDGGGSTIDGWAVAHIAD